MQILYRLASLCDELHKLLAVTGSLLEAASGGVNGHRSIVTRPMNYFLVHSERRTDLDNIRLVRILGD